MRILAWSVAIVVVAMALLFVVGTVLISRLETEERAREPSDPETSFLETRSGRVHILDVGAGDTLLFAHGTGRSVADWQEGLAARLARRHRVVGFDCYGVGLSDREHGLGYGLALWARQAIDVADALEIERFTIVGHSAGGAIAAIVAADNPERVEAAVFLGHGIAMDPAQIVPLLPGLGEIQMGRTEIFGTTFSERHRERLTAAYRIRGTRRALLTFIRRQYTIDGLRLLFRTYGDIEAPVLQVHGGRDASIPLAGARSITPRLGNARFTRFVTLEDASHDVHADAPERLADEIEAFLGEVRRR
jgi:pimeloyl-ACP methyl ester carboxylesterase